MRGSALSARVPPGRSASRAGFTLLELLMALVLTALSVTVASGALRAASTAGDRVREHRDTLEREARLRSMLTDMLRHPPSAESVDEPLLSLTPSTDGTAQLVFLSRGVRAPFGTGSIWRISLFLRADSLVLDAIPIGATRDASVLHSAIPEIEALSIAVRERARDVARGGADAAIPAGGQRDGWRSDWPLTQSRPALIALDFGSRAATSMAPLVVALDPLAAGARP